MSVNPMTCSTCGTENAPGRDTCSNCGLPLTGSADEAVRTNVEAQEHGGVLSRDNPLASDTINPAGGMGAAGGLGTPLDPAAGQPGPDEQGRPPRRS